MTKDSLIRWDLELPLGMRFFKRSGVFRIELRGSLAKPYVINEVYDTVEVDLGFAWVTCWVLSVEPHRGNRPNCVLLVLIGTDERALRLVK